VFVEVRIGQHPMSDGRGRQRADRGGIAGGRVDGEPTHSADGSGVEYTFGGGTVARNAVGWLAG